MRIAVRRAYPRPMMLYEAIGELKWAIVDGGPSLCYTEPHLSQPRDRSRCYRKHTPDRSQPMLDPLPQDAAKSARRFQPILRLVDQVRRIKLFRGASHGSPQNS